MSEYLDHIVSRRQDRVRGVHVVDHMSQVHRMDEGDEFRAVERQEILLRRKLERIGREQEGVHGVQNAIRRVNVAFHNLGIRNLDLTVRGHDLERRTVNGRHWVRGQLPAGHARRITYIPSASRTSPTI